LEAGIGCRDDNRHVLRKIAYIIVLYHTLIGKIDIGADIGKDRGIF